MHPECGVEFHGIPLVDPTPLPDHYLPNTPTLYKGINLSGDSFRKKILFDVPFRRESEFYSEEEVATRLRIPSGYADGTPRTPYLIPPTAKQPRVPVTYIESSDWSLFAEGPMEKTYKGPVYLQGNEGTCHAWALIHAMHVVGLKPDVAVATKLLNGALPSDTNAEGGLGSFMAAGLVGDTAQFTYEFAHELPDRTRDITNWQLFSKKLLTRKGRSLLAFNIQIRPGNIRYASQATSAESLFI